MTELYRGIVRGKLVELEDEAILPEGMRVTVIPEEPVAEANLSNWLHEARQSRAQLPFTSDSIEILQRIRQERVDR